MGISRVESTMCENIIQITAHLVECLSIIYRCFLLLLWKTEYPHSDKSHLHILVTSECSLLLHSGLIAA